MIKPLKKDVKALIEVIDQDYDDMEAAAEAILIKSWSIYDERCKYALFGQLTHTPEQPVKAVPAAEAVKVCLGMYGTEKQAQNAGESLVYNNSSGEVYRTVICAVHQGTPASFHAERKALRNEGKEDLATAKVARIVEVEQARLNSFREDAESSLPDYLR